MEPSEVLLVPTQYVAGLFSEVAERLRQLGTVSRLYTGVAECLEDERGRVKAQVILAMHEFPLSRELLASLPNLRAALSFVTGVESFDERAATELGVAVANGQIEENFHSMAEATLMLLLAAMYDLRGSEQALRRQGPPFVQRQVSMLTGKKVGIIGFGKIAEAVTERLQGWRVDIQIHTRSATRVLPPGVRRVELRQLLETSDALLVLASLNPDSRHLLDRERLNWIKQGAVLVNTARGGLIDEQALVELARTGRFKSIALDTFETEPLSLASPLRNLPNAILTGHDVGHTRETQQALVSFAVENIRRVLRGELPFNIRNPSVSTASTSRWGGHHAA
jgi:phosphoglycerate dehydrogenase-like enzyme